MKSDYSFKETETFKMAVRVLGNSQEAEKWFMKKKLALGNKTPFELCKTSEGVRRVDDILGRMENGVFS